MAHNSDNALALDVVHAPPEEVNDEPRPQSKEPVAPSTREAAPPVSAKIIEFPRFAWAPPPPPPDQLAEPVMDRPRILEVPDCTPAAPALGGITIEPATVEEPEKRPGIDMPLQSAPLGLRIVAAITDGLIISTAAAFFALIFSKISSLQPPQLQTAGIAAGLLLAFWAAYQYLLIVYSGRTPGLLMAHLELTRFDGTPAKRSLRRWRVLASFLSAVSLGMGYIWVFLDEDSLCWHDRITRTYLAPRNLHVREKGQA
jgi:RDD family protein